jgi:polysaccharide pyruvyl transferase WcaK-like protein
LDPLLVRLFRKVFLVITCVSICSHWFATVTFFNLVRISVIILKPSRVLNVFLMNLSQIWSLSERKMCQLAGRRLHLQMWRRICCNTCWNRFELKVNNKIISQIKKSPKNVKIIPVKILILSMKTIIQSFDWIVSQYHWIIMHGTFSKQINIISYSAIFYNLTNRYK